jgi:hypothetical protein
LVALKIKCKSAALVVTCIATIVSGHWLRRATVFCCALAALWLAALTALRIFIAELGNRRRLLALGWTPIGGQICKPIDNLSADGRLMPAKKNQAQPDRRYFKQYRGKIAPHRNQLRAGCA